MDLYQSFDNAVKAEKNAAIGFTVLAAVFVLIGLYLYFVAGRDNPFLVAKWPSLIAGLLMLVGGFVYMNQIKTHADKQTGQYHADRAAFIHSEQERATKLQKGFTQYSWVYAGVGIAALMLIVLFRQSIIGGIGYVVLLFSIYTVFSERYSAVHNGKYLAALTAYAQLTGKK